LRLTYAGSVPRRSLSLVAASFMLAAAAAVTTGLGASWSSRAVADATQSVSHTHEVRANLAEVLSLLTDAETGQRGYMLTADPAYLEPYAQARTAIIGSIAASRPSPGTTTNSSIGCGSCARWRARNSASARMQSS
jgi:CHASE3 domain sensor protein